MFSFIFPVTHWLFSTVLFTLHVFVFFSNFFLVADIWSYTVVVSKDAWYNFSLLNWNLFVVADKGPSSRSYVYPVVMHGCESRTIRKAERWRIDAFELWCWRRRLRVPWTARRTNQSILKGISPEYSLEGLMLKLRLQYFGRLVRRVDLLEKTLMLGKTEGRRRRGDRGWDGWMASPTWWM